MPRNQSRAARRARDDQALTGRKYTKALRAATARKVPRPGHRLVEPVGRLAGALRAAGMEEQAGAVETAVTWQTQLYGLNRAHTLACGRRAQAADEGRPLDKYDLAVSAAWHAIRQHRSDRPVNAEVELMKAVCLVLEMACEAEADRGLLQAAADTLALLDTFDSGAAVRSGWLTTELWETTEGVDHPSAVVARAALRAVVDAACVETGHDDADDADAQRLLSEAAQLASTAAALLAPNERSKART
nr:hypothetical protein [Streptomyces ribosidificus]